MKNRLYVTVNSKGGTGKTNTAIHVLPAIIKESDKDAIIDIIEIDDNNKNMDIYNNSKVINSMQSIALKDALDRLQDVVFDLMEEKENHYIIIDSGGGNDTKEVVHLINELEISEIADLVYIVPFMSSRSQIHNIKEMVTSDIFKDQRVVYALNAVNDSLNLENEFLFWFGNEDLSIPSLYEELNKPESFLIPATPLFDIATITGETLWDYADSARNFSAIEYLKFVKDNGVSERDQLKKHSTIYQKSKAMKDYIANYLTIQI